MCEIVSIKRRVHGRLAVRSIASDGWDRRPEMHVRACLLVT